MLKSLLPKALLTSGGTLVRAVCSLGIQKMVAMWYGPVGITLLNHLQNLMALAVSLPNDGINRGLTTLLNQTEAQQEKAHIKRAGLLWHSAILMLGLGLCLSFPSQFITVFSRAMPVQSWLFVLAFGMAGNFAFSFWCGLRLAEGNVKLFSWLQIISAVVGLALAGIGIIQGKIEIALAWALVGQGMGGVLAWLTTLHYPKVLEAWNQEAVQVAFKKLGHFALMALGITIFGRLADYLLRAYAIGQFNALEIGYWQATVRLSDAFFLPLNAFLTAVTFPELAKVAGRGQQSRKTITDTLLFILPIGWLAVGMVWLFRQEVIVILNDVEFVNGTHFMHWQLAGDALRIPAYIIATLILAQNRPILFLLLEAGSTIVYLLAFWQLEPIWGVEAFVVSHLVRYALYLPTVGLLGWRGTQNRV